MSDRPPYTIEFQGEFMAEWECRALVIWLRFEVETEDYDRSLPGFFFPRTGDWMPHDRTQPKYTPPKRRR